MLHKADIPSQPSKFGPRPGQSGAQPVQGVPAPPPFGGGALLMPWLEAGFAHPRSGTGTLFVSVDPFQVNSMLAQLIVYMYDVILSVNGSCCHH